METHDADRGRRAVAAVAAAALLAACSEGGAPGPSPLPPTPAAAVPAGDAHDAALEDAWRLLEIDRKPDEADAAFRRVASDAAAPPRARGRALLGSARVARLRDDRPAAEALLRRIREEFRAVPGLQTDAAAEGAALAGASARWNSGLVEIRPGQYLDLDSCGLFGSPRTPAGGAAELAGRGDGVEFLAASAAGDEFEGAAPWISPAPWVRVATDLGATAWIQVLERGGRPTGGGAVVRWYTRGTGSGAPLPAPRDAFCVGRGDRIEVHFAPDPAYAAYRVERRISPEAPFGDAVEVARGPVVVPVAPPGAAYGFRITGRTATGDEGVPAELQGTTESLGIRTGSVLLEWGRPPLARPAFDFVTGTVGAAGDVTLVGTYGGRDAAGFEDAAGRRIAGTLAPVRSPWDPGVPSDPDRQVRDGAWIAVAVRGGGVARARVSLEGDSPAVRLDYEVHLDGDAFPEPWSPRAVCGKGAPTRIECDGAPPGWTVRELDVEDLVAAGAARRIAVEGGVGVDPGGVEGTLLRYTARPVDAHGRSGVVARLAVNRLEAVVREGTFEFHYGQGWSFARGGLVGPGDADLLFASCAGGIASITFRGPEGILSLDAAGVGRSETRSYDTWFDAIVLADPEALPVRRDMHADRRSPASDAGVVRTRTGGWAKFAVMERPDGGQDWTRRPVRIRYAYNPVAPVFRTDAEPSRWVSGVGLAPEDAEAALARARGRLGIAVPTKASDETVRRLQAESRRIRFRGVPMAAIRELLEEDGFTVRLEPALESVPFSLEVAEGVPLIRVVDALGDMGYEVTVSGDGALGIATRKR